MMTLQTITIIYRTSFYLNNFKVQSAKQKITNILLKHSLSRPFCRSLDSANWGIHITRPPHACDGERKYKLNSENVKSVGLTELIDAYLGKLISLLHTQLLYTGCSLRLKNSSQEQHA
jgi:hypothetical protein